MSTAAIGGVRQAGKVSENWLIVLVLAVVLGISVGPLVWNQIGTSIAHLRGTPAAATVLEVVDTSVPVWPLGLPGWEDTWVALGLAVPDGDLYLSVWSLPGASSAVSLPLPAFLGRSVTVEPLFPTELGAWDVSWDASAGVLHVDHGGATPTARVLRIRREPATRPEGADAGR